MKRYSSWVCSLFISSACLAQSSAPFNRYLAAAQAGREDQRLVAFARACVDSEIKPARKFFYTEQNDWLAATDLHFAFAGYVTGDANTAEVWIYSGMPRVVYLWEVDLEYQRDTLACLNKEGDVTRSVSRFFPSQSGEPREHWVYIHTVKAGPRVGSWVSVGIYQDPSGKRLARPDLSSEDRDFIAGERAYHYRNDFDFAPQLDPPVAARGAQPAQSVQKETHATP